ncbi:tRNA lysidine(34) synthetase TilS [Senegalia massiliensis]|uniref:tRNA lysidine(34) synthetase TilS n=1 Tax=Senegalia massiliensis TaxID=1720316 RepID=UPI0010323847|nr:tRNA lysidine(34) synthetase TilS [Senegalia massiliensis]
MENKVLKTIEKYNLIKKHDNIIVGVSGGPDSIFLLSILDKIKQKIKFNIVVCHINHGTRGIETDKDEIFVKKLCKKMKVDFHSIKVDMNGYAKEKSISSEEAGRELRYDFFRKILKKYNNKGSVAVAHNKNDQAETMIMRFLRGTGIDGLKGMDFKNGDIIRPVLNISREEIEKYIADNDIEVRIDETNKMDIYRRNKIRLNLIPDIKEEYNPSIIDTLYRTSKIMKVDSDFINNYANTQFDNLKTQISKEKISLDKHNLINQHKAIQYRIIRLAIERLIGHLKEIEQIHIESIINLMENNITGKRIDISNGIEAFINYKYLEIRLKTKEEKIILDRQLNLKNINYINELGLEITLKVEDFNKNKINQKDRFIKYFDYDKIVGGLFIRFRKSGDKFKPLGMKGNKKLKDFFIDEKIPRENREKIPIIYDKQGILWVVGHRISENYKVNSTTKKVLMIAIKNRG